MNIQNFIQNLKTEDLLIFATRKIQEFDEMSNDFIKIFKTCIIKLLQDNNHTKDNKLIFDGEVEDEDERNRPSCISADFDDGDVTDCYINAIWLEDNDIKVEIAPCYLSSEPMEIKLAEVIDNNYRDVLEFIMCNNKD